MLCVMSSGDSTTCCCCCCCCSCTISLAYANAVFVVAIRPLLAGVLLLPVVVGVVETEGVRGRLVVRVG